jgi:hypothetical protein
MRKSLFLFTCRLCGKVIQNGTGAAEHGKKHVKEPCDSDWKDKFSDSQRNQEVALSNGKTITTAAFHKSKSGVESLRSACACEQAWLQTSSSVRPVRFSTALLTAILLSMKLSGSWLPADINSNWLGSSHSLITRTISAAKISGVITRVTSMLLSPAALISTTLSFFVMPQISPIQRIQPITKQP